MAKISEKRLGQVFIDIGRDLQEGEISRGESLEAAAMLAESAESEPRDQEKAVRYIQ